MFENLDEVEKRYEELTKKIYVTPEEIAKQNEWRKKHERACRLRASSIEI